METFNQANTVKEERRQHLLCSQEAMDDGVLDVVSAARSGRHTRVIDFT